MKVVLFCGGQGLRARDGAPGVPKPLQVVGGLPMLWHVMSWYARQGHTDFVLCTGYRGEAVRSWFTRHAVGLEPDADRPGQDCVMLFGGDMDGWRITFARSGQQASVGMRLRAVRPLVAGEELFLANYADVFCDVPLTTLLERARDTGAVATLLAVRPNHSFHVLDVGDDGCVSGITPAVESNQWINGGYFVLRPSVFDVLRPGEDLVAQPFERLIARGQLQAHRHTGFWAPLDTEKDRQRLETMWQAGDRPWTRAGTTGTGVLAC